jgi:signal peptidase I
LGSLGILSCLDQPGNSRLEAAASLEAAPWGVRVEPDVEAAGVLSVALFGKGRQQNGSVSLVLKGLSMAPFFREGQTVTVDCAPEKPIRTGDVIVFEVPGRLCAHRVLARGRRNGEVWYVQKGDNQLVRSVVKQGEVLGKVVAVDGHPLPLSVGLAARAGRWLYAKWAYVLSGLAGMLELPLLRQASRRFPSVETRTRNLCLRASRGFLKVLMFVFKAPNTTNI